MSRLRMRFGDDLHAYHTKQDDDGNMEQVGDANGEAKEYAYYSDPVKTVSRGSGYRDLIYITLLPSMGVTFVQVGRLNCESLTEPMLGEL